MSFLPDLLFPDKCIFCGKLVGRGEILCPDCRKSAPWYQKRKTKPQFLDSVTAVWYYKENVRSGILRMKFGKQRFLAAKFGTLLGIALHARFPEGFDYVTWVPVSGLRRWKRGFDQARILADFAGEQLGRKPVRLLKKVRNNPAQSGISDASRRRANVMGVYRLIGRADLRGKRILLIDDVLTTGATAGECAKLLRQAGAEEVHCGVAAASAK